MRVPLRAFCLPSSVRRSRPTLDAQEIECRRRAQHLQGACRIAVNRVIETDQRFA